MANIKPMVDHLARGLAGLVDFDKLSGPTQAALLAKATTLLAGAPVLYDVLREEKLRNGLSGLLAYCEQSSVDEDWLGDDFTEGSINAYADVAAKLREILK